MREASTSRTATDTDSYAFSVLTKRQRGDDRGNVIKPMTICLEDENLRDFIQEIQDNACLREIFAASKYWKQGGEEAVNLLNNYNFKTIPEEVASVIEKLLTDVCPDSCEACGCPIEWNQMSATLLNGDNLCDYHHQRKERMEKE